MAYGHPNTRRTVYVVFQDLGETDAWTVFTKPGMRHCWCFWTSYYPDESLLATRFTVKFEPLRWGFHSDVWYAPPEDVIAEFSRPPVSCIIAFDVDYPPQNFSYMIPRGLITCVSAVKAMMGLRNWRILTPAQLAEYLLAEGGRLIYPEGAQDGSNRIGIVRRR